MPERVVVRASEADAQADPNKNGGANFDQSKDARGANGTFERVSLSTERQSQSDESQTTDTSKLIFGKYKTMEEAEKAFKALESNIGKPKEQTQQAPVTTPKIEGKDFDWTEVRNEFAKDGKVSDAAYAKAAEKGLSKTDVDNYVSTQKATAEKYASDLAAVVGGQEQLDALVEWAKANLTVKQAKSVQAAIDSMDLDQATLALEGLNARYVAAMGKDPALVNAETKGTRATGVQPYGDVEEMIRDMQNPKYRTSPAFQKQVQDRLAAGMDMGGLAVRAL